MSTALIHGDPGSFKTASLVNDYLVPAVQAGRVVVTNIRGVKSPEEIAEIYKFPLPDTAEIINVDFNQDGFELIARFFHWAPVGALILMDEGQRVYPTRLRNFQAYDYSGTEERPATVEDAFDSHRHYNWDIYISTPNISKIHKEVRAVAEFAYRHKNLATIFSFLKGRYKRVVHNAENSGATISNVVASSLRKMDVRAFDVYESTATGKTKDSSTSISLFKQPKVLLLLLVIGYSAWNMYSTFNGGEGLPVYFGGDSQPSSGTAIDKNHQISNPSPASASGRTVSIGPANNVIGSANKNPFLAASFFFVGEFNNATYFQVEFADKSILTFNSWELENIGFNIARFNNSTFKFSFGDQQFYVFNKPLPHIDSQANLEPPDVSAFN